MKKILFTLLMFILMPFIVNANTEKYYIEANILNNGDMQIKELKILDGSFNGAITSLRYKNASLKTFSGVLADFEGSSIYNASNLEDLKVYSVYFSDKEDFNIINNVKDEFNLVTSASKGDYGVYTKELTGEGVNILQYLPSSYNYAFLVTYTLKDAVVIHNDVAEIAWDFIGDSYEETINDLKIRINLPSESTELRVFSHGPLTGSNKITSKKSVMAEWEYLPAGKSVDVRVVFDKILVSSGTKKSNIDGLENILNVEEKRANKANEEREDARRYLEKRAVYEKILTVVSILYSGFVIVMIVLMYNKYDKERKSTFIHKYNRDFIDDYNVEVIDYLMKRNITPNAMSASILNLIYKKNIKAEEIVGKKNKKEYKFTLINKDKINETEGYLIEFLFESVGNGSEFTTIELKDYAKSTNTYNKFSTKYSSWKRKVESDGIKENFYEKNNKPKLYGFLTLAGSIIILIIANALNALVGFVIISVILSVVFLIYTLFINKKTEKGMLHYSKWKAFKNFLNDFGTFKDKELPEIILWERYLIYATIFGLANKVEKSMNVKIKEMNLDSSSYDFPTFVYLNIGDSINDSVNEAVKMNTQKIAEVASSQNSSSGGFGGGASFGGGGFGGGGSGGGRF